MDNLYRNTMLDFNHALIALARATIKKGILWIAASANAMWVRRRAAAVFRARLAPPTGTVIAVFKFWPPRFVVLKTSKVMRWSIDEPRSHKPGISAESARI